MDGISKFVELIAGLLAQFLVGVSGILAPFALRTASYTEHKRLISNPDRGVYIQISTPNKDTMYRYSNKSGVEDMRLTLLAFELDNYPNKEYLDNKKLEELEKALIAAEETNYSVIFRSAYGFAGKNFQDAKELSYILNHIEQICEVLSRHKDIILCVQAGMLGPYGEWHSSTYMKGGYNEMCHAVLMKWLECLPEEICVALRRPCFVRSAVEMGADINRLIVHNDALLSSDSDMGTFSDKNYTRAEEVLYTGKLSPIYMGGEMTGLSEYTEVETAISEFRTMEINYLNKYYNEAVWKDWAKKEYNGWSADVYIRAHLGYRLVLKQITELTHGEEKDLILCVENVGFGELDSRVAFYLFLDDGETTVICPVSDTDEEKNKYRFCVTVPTEKEYNIGIAATRFPLSETKEKFFITFANEEAEFKDGVNYFSFPQSE